MNILVTGGAGFIGTNLIEYLLEFSDGNQEENTIKIVSLDNYLSGKKENHILDKRVEYIEGNTWDAESIFDDEQTFDIIFHFGEYSRIVYSFEEIKILQSIYIKGNTSYIGTCKKMECQSDLFCIIVYDGK